MWNYLQVVLTSISLLISSTKLTVRSHLRKFSSHTSTDGGAGLSEKTSTSRLAPAEGVEFRLSRSVKGCVVPWERNISKHNLLTVLTYREHQKLNPVLNSKQPPKLSAPLLIRLYSNDNEIGEQHEHCYG